MNVLRNWRCKSYFNPVQFMASLSWAGLRACALSPESILFWSPGRWLANPGCLRSRGRMMLSTPNDSVAINQSRKPLAQRDITMEPIWLGNLMPALSRVGSPYLGCWFLCDQNKLWAAAVVESSLAFLSPSLPGAGAWLSKPEGWCQDCFIQQRWLRANKHH